MSGRSAENFGSRGVSRAMAEVDFILQLDKLAQDSGIQSIIDPKEFGKEDSGS